MERSHASNKLHHVLTGITRQCDPEEYAKRWSRPGKVAHIVQTYEQSSLTNSPGAQPGSPRKEATRSSPVVSASLFHQARARSASRSQPAQFDKENNNHSPRPVRPPAPSFSSTSSSASASRFSASAPSIETWATTATDGATTTSNRSAHIQVAHRLQSASPHVLSLADSTPGQAPAPTARKRSATYTAGTETPEQRLARVNAAFAQMLDVMQIPTDEVRQRMMTLSLTLKEEMLKSSAHKAQGHSRSQSLSASQSSQSRSLTKRTKSSTSLNESQSSLPGSPTKQKRSRANSASSLFRSLGRSAGKEAKSTLAVIEPPQERDAPEWVALLRTPARQLGPKEVNVLRGRLRNESPAWIDDFVKSGGYQLLLDRFGELYTKEWREEQHDDQLLHSLLKCYVALTLTHVGKKALASKSPTPFVQMTELLFSEKRPGDLACRQLLIEMVLALFSIHPPTARAVSKTDWKTNLANDEQTASAATAGPKRYTRAVKGEDDEHVSIEQQIMTHLFARSLMMGPPDEKEEAKVDFIRGAHQPRIFKRWVREMLATANDYFWIFCHKSNTFWPLQCVDEKAIDTPRVPTGMTGGVEYEAMQYCTAHLKLLNALIRSAPNMEAAFQLHHDMFMSGFERVLMTLRRSSTTFYPLLHLEMASFAEGDQHSLLSLTAGGVIMPSYAHTLRKRIDQMLSSVREATGTTPSPARQGYGTIPTTSDPSSSSSAAGPNNQNPSAGDGSKIEPKVWLAAERTYLNWLRVSLLISSFALALFNAAGKHDAVGRAMGVVYCVIAVGMTAYAWHMQRRRREKILSRYAGSHDDLWGPVVVCVVIFAAVLANFLFRVRQREFLKDGHHGKTPKSPWISTAYNLVQIALTPSATIPKPEQ